MPKSSFFTKLGLFSCQDFLDSDVCTVLKQSMQAAESYSATIRNGKKVTVKEHVRLVNQVSLTPSVVTQVTAAIQTLFPSLEKHFQVTIAGMEEPQFLIYRPGNFFTPHQDCTGTPEVLEVRAARKVSVVIFLNSPSSHITNEGYTGGHLKFYGLLKDPPWDQCGLPLEGEEGLLVAFPSALFHEVTPVTLGTRYTIVAWLY